MGNDDLVLISLSRVLKQLSGFLFFLILFLVFHSGCAFINCEQSRDASTRGTILVNLDIHAAICIFALWAQKDD